MLFQCLLRSCRPSYGSSQALIPIGLLGCLFLIQRGQSQTVIGESPLGVDPSQTYEVSGKAPWTLTPKQGFWNLSGYESILIRLKSRAFAPVTIWARAENDGAQLAQDTVRVAIVLPPGNSGVLRLRLMPRPEDPTYAPFRAFFMYSKAINVRDNTIDPSRVARLVVWVQGDDQSKVAATIESVLVDGVRKNAKIPFFPFIDRYGQYIHTDWPNKIHSDVEFAEMRNQEGQDMQAHPGPNDWDKWGGWKDGQKVAATGFFYPKKVRGKWWLVDPDGQVFWSYGPTGVGFGEGTPITDRESWFDNLPDKRGSFARYWGKGENERYMYYKNKSYQSLDFSSLNAERIYGPDWRSRTVNVMHQRLRNWGFNSIGNWSDPVVYLRRKTPYVVAIHYKGKWSERVPDVFNPLFAAAVNARMEGERGRSAGDPYCIGYFVDNELQWEYLDRGEGMAQHVLCDMPASVSKRILLTDLRRKYRTVADLNKAWGAHILSWQALQNGRVLPEASNKNVRSKDLGDFGVKFAERYFSVVRNVVKKVAPNNLYLGCRFHGHIDTALIKIAAKYADVISYNVYELPNDRLNRFVGVIDKPFIVGEFGVESDPWQTPFRNDARLVDPMERVHSLQTWMRQAIAHPLLVGAHFFQFRDQPISGRGDGEAVLRGFLNGTDTPHFDLVQANRTIGSGLYQNRSKN